MRPYADWLDNVRGGCCICPYCAYASTGSSLKLTPTVPEGDGIVDPSEVVWESRCPRCGGDFVIRTERKVIDSRLSAPAMERFADMTARLDVLESMLDDMYEHPRGPKGPVPPMGVRR